MARGQEQEGKAGSDPVWQSDLRLANLKFTTCL